MPSFRAYFAGLLLSWLPAIPNAAAAGAVAPAHPEPQVLTRVEQIRRLTPAQAARGYRVHVRAVVTYYAPALAELGTDPDMFVQDSTAGIWVTAPATAPQLRAGQIVDLEGVTEEPDFAVQIGKPTYRVVGEGPLPRPRRPSFESMISTVDDAQWVEVEGIVRHAERHGVLILDVAVAGGRVRVFIPDFRQWPPDRLVDAKVRLRGACGAQFNQNNQLIGVVLYVPSRDQMDVLQAAPADPFAVPPQPIATLQQFAPQRAIGHLVHVQGVVLLQDGADTAYIFDGRNGIRVSAGQPIHFRPGDKLDVVGFPLLSDFRLSIEDALCRRTGGSSVPVPLSVTAEQILNGDYDSLPVAIEGRLLVKSYSSNTPALRRFVIPRPRTSTSGSPDSGISTLVLESGGTIFEALLQQPQDARTLPPAEAHLRLSGVCLANRDTLGRTRSFRILLPSRDSIHVTRYPSWWTAERTRAVMGILSLVIFAVGAWVISLRRRVRGQIAVIRERLEREAALEQRCHSLLNNANDIIFTLHPQGTITSINRAGERISGYTQEEVVGAPLFMLFAVEGQVIEDAIQTVLRDRSYSGFDWSVAGKDGRRTHVDVSLERIEEGGLAAGILGISRDISDRKGMEQALQRAVQLARARDEAEEASRAKSTFLATMSHELRTPLNAIIGYSQMLQENYPDTEQEELRNDLEKIERSGHLLLGIINDILDLSRIESGRESMKPQVVDVANILDDVCGTVRPLAQQRGNLLEIDCPLEAGTAFADVAKFRQSVLNLVVNACKFTENGRVSVTVSRVRNAHGDWTDVHVSDTGIGITPEDLNKLFQPFSQVDGSACRKYSGTGLGLAISKKYCQMMGGDITVTSQVGHGSRFSIRVPAREIRAANTPGAA